VATAPLGDVTGAELVAGVLGDEDVTELVVGVVLVLDCDELDGLLLHAVIASATMPVAAMAWTDLFTTPPVVGVCRRWVNR